MIQIISFLAVFLGIFGGISFYVFIRGLQSIQKGSRLRIPYIVLYWIIAVSFFAGRILENYHTSFLINLLSWVGSLWIAALLYFFIAVVLLDILRLINHFVPFFPAAITQNYPLVKRTVFCGITGLVGLLILAGHINSIYPRVTELNLAVDKKAGNLEKLNIVMASDIHLGTIIGRSRLARIVDKINSLDPDLVLLPGDIVDSELTSIKRNSLGQPLKDIRARFGVYAVTGNHEYIGGIEETSAYLTDHNITLLRDQAIKVADAVYLVGREDLSANRFGNISRKNLTELMQGVDKRYAVILMDHQPFGLEEAASNGVDLQLSGHTHYGQLWPINYIVRSVYELPWGYMKKGDTHYYVSNGVGTWGPPVRIGNRPEIVHIQLEFE
ncbi:MAG: metallophosphoesterase [Acidobacteria bacterium]|nr:metallophosphoesterase [Acidobacteriota bacterium]